MRFRFGCCLALTLAACGAQALERADFTTGEGTNGWMISAVDYLSPTYAGAVDRISLSYSGAAAGSATVRAIENGGGEVPVATLSAAATAATFDFPETTDFRSFRIAAQNGWTLTSFSAEVSSPILDAPGDVTISNNITGTSFDANWSPVAGATGYKVYVWTNVTAMVEAGEDSWKESFSNAPAKSSSTDFRDEYTDSGVTHWPFYKTYAHTEAGMVRIGNTTTQGALVSPPLPRFVQQMPTMRICASRQADSDGTTMPIKIVSGDTTNDLVTIELSTSPAIYDVALPSLCEGDRIMFCSTTDKRSCRVILDEVAILSDFYVEKEAPCYIVEARNTEGEVSCTLEGLPSEAVYFAVSAVGRRGAASAMSSATMIDLSNPDKVSMLNACTISSLTDWAYVQDFDSLAPFDGKKWLNGTTLQYWQAWLDGDAVTEFKSGATAGMRKCSSNDVTCALGALGRKGSYVYWGLAFTNDTEYAVKLSEVAYAAQQWSLQNSVEQPLSLSVLVTNRLDWISSFGENWKACCSTAAQCSLPEGHPTPIETSVSFSPSEPIIVGSGEVLLLKWTLEPQGSGSSAMMAIDDLTVTFSRVSRALVLHIH